MNMDDCIKLTSWRSANDPRTGNFTFELDEELRKGNIYVTRKRTTTCWKSGDSGRFGSSNELPFAGAYLLSNFSKNVYYCYKSIKVRVPSYNNMRLLMNSFGEIQYFSWSNDNNNGWSLIWSETHDHCSIYNACGRFGSCNSQNGTVCKCVAGFEPASPENWFAGDFKSGCTRKSKICNNKEESDIFVNLKKMKVGNPDTQYEAADSEKACRDECLGNCLCQAYTYNPDDDTRRGKFTVRDCEPCGNNIIPYPLSTGPTCVDPLYYSFYCDDSTGQVLFRAVSGNYLEETGREGAFATRTLCGMASI
ncbi:unnamed protein product [Ilex paraguariensis]|uniref:non-specific serine/threonine protein kinase n=1 Tax=Ilex paraguariensis TaxID=185542 RepID=A0ABC8SWU8_9AQUA